MSADHLVPPPSVRVFLPALALQGYVTFYYIVDTAGPLTDFLYPEWGNVRFALAGTWRVDMPGHYPSDPQVEVLYGPTDRCGSVSATAGRMAGFGLTPLGWQRFIGSPANAMANRVRPLDDAFGVAARALREKLASDADDAQVIARLDRLLTALAATRGHDDPLIVAADHVLRSRPATVPGFASGVGVAPRTLHGLCLRAFGFPPKRLLRRQRFLDTLGQVRSAVGQSLETALDLDYCDQPHFYRNFHDFMGMSPHVYFKASRALMARAAAAQAAAGVSLSFKLPAQPAAPR